MSILPLPAADEEYLSRLAALTEAHPEVEMVIIPEPDGETIVVRYTPRALLGKLAALLGTGEDTRSGAYMRLAALLRDQITPIRQSRKRCASCRTRA